MPLPTDRVLFGTLPHGRVFGTIAMPGGGRATVIDTRAHESAMRAANEKARAVLDDIAREQAGALDASR